MSDLGPEGRAARLRLLDTLAAYRRAGVFLRNTAAPGRTPVFIDEGGRICAVGRLIEASAGRATAEAIAEAHRLDRIAAMPASVVAPWAKAHGFSLVELAMIQPMYCGPGWETGECPGHLGEEEPMDERVEAAAWVAGGFAAAANAALLAGDRQRRWVGGAGVLVGGGLVAHGLSGDANWQAADLAMGGAALAAGLWQAVRSAPAPGVPEVAVVPVRAPG